MKKHFLFVTLAFFILSTFFYSCKKTTTPPEDTGYLHGAYITNEGGFNKNNGSISYIDLDSSYVVNNLFQSINNRPLGDVVQSFTVAGDKGLIVVNNSAKVEVVDMKTFVSLGTITGCNYPRYALATAGEEAYLTNGAFAGKVYVLDLTGMEITDSITVGSGPEEMVKLGDYVYVANSGGWSIDSTVSVIDVKSRKVVKNIVTGDNPVALKVDGEGDIWVLCKGRVLYDPQDWSVIYESDSKLEVISATTQEVKASYVIGEKGDSFNPQRLAVNGNGTEIYFIEKDGIYRVDIHNPEIPDSPFIHGNFYGMGIDPATGMIYAVDAKDFSENGVLSRYLPDGTLQDKVTVGIAPNGVYFN